MANWIKKIFTNGTIKISSKWACGGMAYAHGQEPCSKRGEGSSPSRPIFLCSGNPNW